VCMKKRTITGRAVNWSADTAVIETICSIVKKAEEFEHIRGKTDPFRPKKNFFFFFLPRRSIFYSEQELKRFTQPRDRRRYAGAKPRLLGDVKVGDDVDAGSTIWAG